MFIHPDTALAVQRGNNARPAKAAPGNVLKMHSNNTPQQQPDSKAGKGQMMMRRLTDVTNKMISGGNRGGSIMAKPVLNNGSNYNGAQNVDAKDPKQHGSSSNNNNNNNIANNNAKNNGTANAQYGIPQLLNMGRSIVATANREQHQHQQQQQKQAEPNIFGGNQAPIPTPAQLAPPPQQQQQQQMQRPHQPPGPLPPRNAARPQQAMPPPQHAAQEDDFSHEQVEEPQVIRVQLTFSDQLPMRQRKQKRTAKKRPVVRHYHPMFSPVREDKFMELSTPQRHEMMKSATSTSSPVAPNHMDFSSPAKQGREYLVHTATAQPGEAVVVADAFAHRPFFSKYAGHVGTLLRRSQAPGGGGWMVDFGVLGVQFFSTGSINGVHHLAYAPPPGYNDGLPSTEEASIPPPNINTPCEAAGLAVRPPPRTLPAPPRIEAPSQRDASKSQEIDVIGAREMQGRGGTGGGGGSGGGGGGVGGGGGEQLRQFGVDHKTAEEDPTFVWL